MEEAEDIKCTGSFMSGTACGICSRCIHNLERIKATTGLVSPPKPSIEIKQNINTLAADALDHLRDYESYSKKIRPSPPGYLEGFEAGVKYLRDSFLEAKEGGWLAYDLTDDYIDGKREATLRNLNEPD